MCAVKKYSFYASQSSHIFSIPKLLKGFVCYRFRSLFYLSGKLPKCQETSVVVIKVFSLVSISNNLTINNVVGWLLMVSFFFAWKKVTYAKSFTPKPKYPKPIYCSSRWGMEKRRSFNVDIIGRPWKLLEPHRGAVLDIIEGQQTNV